MAFHIPKEEVPAIKTLKDMPAVTVESFIKALKSAPPTVHTDETARRIKDQVPSIPTTELEAVLDTLYGLYYIRELSGVERETFLDDFIEGLQEQPDLAVDGKDVHKLRSKFGKLLNIDSFNLLSKAKRLQRDGERLYCDAKIVSDIRSVFGAKPTARPTSAVVTHTLKLGYHEMGNHREFHVVLDSIDLELLGAVIQRAQLKNKTLQSLLKEMGLPNLGV